jgi:hypothetical protein
MQTTRPNDTFSCEPSVMSFSVEVATSTWIQRKQASKAQNKGRHILRRGRMETHHTDQQVSTHRTGITLNQQPTSRRT